MPDDRDVYRLLQQHLDRMPVGFPATASGVELRILRRLFTPEEAGVALLLGMLPERLERIHRRDRGGGRSREQLERILDRLAEKGAILGGHASAGREGTKRYSKALLAIGVYELQVDRLTKELQADFEQYLQEAFGRALLTGKTTQLRTVPVNARFLPERRVGRYDDARSLLQESRGPFAVMNCVCRQGRDLLGEPCRQTKVRRTCLALRSVARSVLASGTGIELTRQEALALVERAEQEAMVLQPANTQDPLFMCFCCGCCCGMLRAARQFPRPAAYLQSNYHAVVVAELCNDCQTCRGRCPMAALGGDGGVAAVDLDRCIGCGLCVSTCPTGAIRLASKPEPVVPSRDSNALYLRLLRERYGLLRSAGMIGKALAGRRV
jgi:Na+-translocating ferredoxin:NAD+ oxidoreductase subunit B